MKVFSFSHSFISANVCNFKLAGCFCILVLSLLFTFQFSMYNEGDIIRSVDLLDPTSGRVSQLFRKVKHMMVRSTSSELMLEDHLILLPLLKVCIRL